MLRSTRGRTCELASVLPADGVGLAAGAAAEQPVMQDADAPPVEMRRSARTTRATAEAPAASPRDKLAHTGRGAGHRAAAAHSAALALAELAEPPGQRG